MGCSRASLNRTFHLVWLESRNRGRTCSQMRSIRIQIKRHAAMTMINQGLRWYCFPNHTTFYLFYSDIEIMDSIPFVTDINGKAIGTWGVTHPANELISSCWLLNKTLVSDYRQISSTFLLLQYILRYHSTLFVHMSKAIDLWLKSTSLLTFLPNGTTWTRFKGRRMMSLMKWSRAKDPPLLYKQNVAYQTTFANKFNFLLILNHLLSTLKNSINK